MDFKPENLKKYRPHLSDEVIPVLFSIFAARFIKKIGNGLYKKIDNFVSRPSEPTEDGNGVITRYTMTFKGKLEQVDVITTNYEPDHIISISITSDGLINLLKTIMKTEKWTN